MKSRIIRIGNSQGIRIPKPLLDQTGLAGDVELEVRAGEIVIRPARTNRAGWSAALQSMAEAGDDELLEALTESEWDREEWEW
jgi:antitoxin MazE